MEEFDMRANDLQEKENLVNGFLGTRNFQAAIESDDDDSCQKARDELYGKEGMSMTNTFMNLLRSPQMFSPGSNTGRREDDEMLLDS
jgi:hypothetical protein